MVDMISGFGALRDKFRARQVAVFMNMFSSDISSV